jgi:hypothetical protein
MPLEQFFATYAGRSGSDSLPPTKELPDAQLIS